MMTTFFKKKLLVVLSLMMSIAILASGAIFGLRMAKADDFSFETVQNAQIRIHNEKERLGIRYQIRMESDEYETFMQTYTNVEFGAFIIPEDYRVSKGDFTEENLFTNPIYYWGDVAEEYKADKTQIINLSTNAMNKVEVEGGVSYNTVYCAITNVKPQNATRAFAGVGYVKYTDGETVKYIISDNGNEYSYSIAQVANNALENLELEDEQVTALEEITAIKPAVKVNSSVTSTALKNAVNGLSYAMGEELDITAVAQANAPAGMVLDAVNSTLKATVPYNGYAKFDVKYNYNVGELSGKNLLEYNNLFDTNGLITKTTPCNNGCWNQFLNISASDVESWGYEGKYLNMYWHCWSTNPFLYFNQDFVDAMVASGNTVLTIVAAKSNSAITMRLHDYNPETGTKSGALSGEGTTEGKLTTYTCDLSKISFENCLAMCGAGTATYKLYVVDINFSAPAPIKITNGSTGNLTGRLLKENFATSTLNTEGKGQLFNYGSDDLYFNAWSGYGNYIVFDSAFVKYCFDNGLTNIKISYYVTSFNSGWVKIGPARNFVGAEKPEYLSSRASSPWLSADYNSSNPISTTWEITASEIASLNFAAGDQLCIGEMASGSGKAQVLITHLEFCAPAVEEVDYDGLNLLSLENVFNTTLCELECANSASHNKCWVQYLDISETNATAWGYSGKYINMSRTGSCDVGLYIDEDFYQEMIDQGMTTLTVVAKKSKGDMNIKFYNYDTPEKLWGDRIEGAPTTGDNDLTTWTFDLTSINVTNIPMIGMTGGVDGALYIVEVSFSK